jgi:ubiquinone/menaquinone biosynthesis C-methylase UbiE
VARTDIERWDRWARTYDRGLAQRFVLRPLYAKILEIIDPRPGERMLDIGAGTGTVVAQGTARGAGAFGVDPSVEMVRVAHGKAPGRFVVAAAEGLPFPTAAFDVVTTSMSMHHWRAAEEGLAEIGRVLRPRGRALVADIARRGLAGRITDLVGRLGRHRARYLGTGELAAALRAAGLEPVRRVVYRRGILLTLAERAG